MVYGSTKTNEDRSDLGVGFVLEGDFGNKAIRHGLT